MKRLFFLFDMHSAFCQRSLQWLEKQPAYLEIKPLPAQAWETQRRFPGVVKGHADEIVVVSDEGGVYRGPEAVIMCLYALRRYRVWARRLSRPEQLPLAPHRFGLLVTEGTELGRWSDRNVTRQPAAAISGPIPYAQFAEPNPASHPPEAPGARPVPWMGAMPPRGPS